MKNIILIVFSAALILFSNSIISAQNGKLKRERALKSIHALKLNDIQKEKISDMFFEVEEINIDLQSAIKKNRLEVKKIIAKKEFTDEELLDLIDKGTTLRNEVIKSKVSFWLDVNKLLDEDQKDTWKKHFNRIIMENKRLSQRGNREYLGREERHQRFDKRSDRF